MAETMPRRRNEVSEESMVSAFAEDIAVHGYKVVSHSVTQSHDKNERSLSVKAVKSTGEAEQTNMDLRKKKKAGEDDS